MAPSRRRTSPRPCHGQGNILLVQGAPTQPTSVAGYQGAKAALADCPGIHIAGTVVGQYENSVAKSVTLQFLSSYSGTINGVYDGGVMSQGELSAFQQLGKPIPAITNLGAVLGTLAYWYQHQSTFGARRPDPVATEYDPHHPRRSDASSRRTRVPSSTTSSVQAIS